MYSMDALLLNKKYNCSGPLAFKSQKVEYQSNQKLPHHYQHENNQPNSYIHSEVQQILGSYELKSHCHFWQGPLKNDWINLQLPWICKRMQKISLFYLFSFEIFQSPMTRLATPIFDHAHPINFSSAFNFCESVSTCKKSVYSISSFFR